MGSWGAISLTGFHFCLGADLWEAHEELWNQKKRQEEFLEDFFLISPALVSTRKMIFSSEAYNLAKIGCSFFLQASSTFLTHKPKTCHISIPFSKAWGHEKKGHQISWSMGEKRAYFLPDKWLALKISRQKIMYWGRLQPGIFQPKQLSFDNITRKWS